MENHAGRPLPSRRRRTQAERDALTVEIGYALCSAVFAAALAFGAVAGPAFAFDLSDGARHALVASATTAACVLFAARVISVLVRFGRAPGLSPASPAAPAPTRRPGPRVGPGRGRPA